MLPENIDLRAAYIGTHNYEIGVNLAKLAQKIKPEGGTVCIQSGGAAAANHNERMQGIRDTLGGKTGTTSPGEPLTGENGWTEAQGCPLYTNDDFPLAVQQFQDFMAANPDLDAFIPTGGFPQFVPDANRAAVEPYKAQDRRRLAGARRRRHAAGADRPDEGGPLGRPGRAAAVRDGLPGDAWRSSRWPTAAPRRRTRATPASTSARRKPPTPASRSDKAGQGGLRLALPRRRPGAGRIRRWKKLGRRHC